MRRLFKNETALATHITGEKIDNYSKRIILSVSKILDVSPLEVIGDVASPEQRKFYKLLNIESSEATGLAEQEPDSVDRVSSTLLGRSLETREIVDLILSKGFQVVSIVAPPGVGKTELSREVSRKVEEHTEWSVRFIDMTVATSEPGIAYEVARSFPGAERLTSGQVENLQREIGYFLKDRGDTLLILDNFEQVEECSLSTFCTWLSIAPKLRIVVTSRCIVNGGNTRLKNFFLKPLDHPSLEQCATWAEAQITRTDAYQLFKNRSENFWTDSNREKLNNEEIRTIGRIVAKCGGFPASIALSAELIRFYDLHQIETALAKEVFTHENQGERRALYNALQSLLDKGLSKQEHEAFYQSSNFVSGFTKTAFDRIVSRDNPNLQKAWIKLISYNLIRPTKTTTRRREKLMGFYLPIKEYAKARWAETANLKTIGQHEKHFRSYYVEEAKRLDLLVKSEKRVEVLKEMADIRENILKIVDVDISQNRPSDALESLLSVRESFRLQGPAAVYLEYIQRLYGFKSAYSKLEMATLMREHAIILWNLGEFGDASDTIEETTNLVADLGDHLIHAKCLESLSLTPGKKLGIEYYRQRLKTELKAKEIYTRLGDKRGDMLNGGYCLDWLGNSPESIIAYEKSIDAAKELGDPYEVARFINGLGLVLWRDGRSEQAINKFSEAKEIFESLDDKNYIGGCFTNMGLAFTDIGETDEEIGENLASALDRFERGKRIFEDISNRSWLGVNLVGQMRMMCREGSFIEAIEWGEEHRAAILGSPYEETHILFSITEALAHYELGEYQKSVESVSAILEKLILLGVEKNHRGFTASVCLSASFLKLGELQKSKDAAVLANGIAHAKGYTLEYRVKYVRERFALFQDTLKKLNFNPESAQ